jgi:hypothetical protein
VDYTFICSPELLNNFPTMRGMNIIHYNERIASSHVVHLAKKKKKKEFISYQLLILKSHIVMKFMIVYLFW